MDLADPANCALVVDRAVSRFGRLDGGTDFLFVRKTGWLPDDVTLYRIRGIYSGAIFLPATAAEYASTAERKYHRWLDYEQFRGFFLVSLQQLQEGEFGMAYDTTTQFFAYDVPASYGLAYDGFPRTARDVYRRTWNALDTARAGGVGFELETYVDIDGPIIDSVELP